jgi:hypothetical protein
LRLNPEKIQKFFALKRVERGLLLRSFLLVGLIRVGLWVVSLPCLIKLLVTLSRPSPPANRSGNSMDSVVWAVAVASRYLPQATCLVRGLAAQVLLADAGIPSDLCIGVTKDDPTSFEAHAWVETDGRVLIGGPRIDRYTRLTSFPWKLK